jgi:hypothetical protein
MLGRICLQRESVYTYMLKYMLTIILTHISGRGMDGNIEQVTSCRAEKNVK